MVPLFNRDLSWLSFNFRVLTMAQDPQVPLYERIKFLSIYSSNLDEFFRVRMPAILAVNKLLEKEPSAGGDESVTTDTLRQVLTEVNRQQENYGRILVTEILPLLKANGVHLCYKEAFTPAQLAVTREYLLTTVLAYLQPVWLQAAEKNYFPENNALYLAVSVSPLEKPDMMTYVLLNIPSVLPRFYQPPKENDLYQILMLDDIIRYHLEYILPGYIINGAYSFKLTRNAEMDMDEFKGDILEEVETLIRKRELGVPTRFLYDAAMPPPLQQYLANIFDIKPEEMVAGGMYHNLKDLNDLPLPAPIPNVFYPKYAPVQIPETAATDHILDLIQQKDLVVHVPYQRYDYVLRFFNEAAIDPDVQEIYVTLYRIASSSQIAQALISAAKNGKQVTVFVELKARFDEANNIRWSKRMKEAGVKIVYSIPGMKVHAKTALVKRKRGYHHDYSGLIATGNFNETTARFYGDHVLFTAHAGITREMELLFIYLQSREQPGEYGFIQFNHLLVAQFNMITRFNQLIDREIANAKAGKPAKITIKLNNLQEKAMIAKLYEASDAGIQIDLIVRSICCLVPSPNIRVVRIVDRYLEHARIFIFHNEGQEEVYIGSADWMNRNLHRRIEVCVPVYDPAIQQQLKDIVAIQLADPANAQANITGYIGKMQ
ncbi:polyphosphate kinase 1 [Chitinophaga sp. sic0106]|uniref:polyphosphate kinase 1 n=1 Tax=Chitinophaga sp. sic0106 TaxID=2854785 RepID=UPI001C4508BC|nr:polyphosphate kinase 1 [Chitinophaga sp. sic0106]MBV7532605.1 polyphosphate kinase 1 [Chitinophaga sp. sic0106]